MYQLARLLATVEQLKQQRGSLSLVRDVIKLDQMPARQVILRCDVERALDHHLVVARELAQQHMPATMYFHTRRACFDPDILKAIQDLGHEVGYHHECLDRCQGDAAKARELFLREVDLFRQHGLDLRTVCAHGEAGLPKQGYRTNWELFHAYPDLIEQAGLDGEVYLWLQGQDLLYTSDVFVSYRRFWEIIDEAKQSDKPLMILTHLHRWHHRSAPTMVEIYRDLQQQAKNRILRRRTYDLAY